MEKSQEVQVGNQNNLSEIQMAPFGPDTVYDFKDKYDDQKWALKTLVEIVAEVDFGQHVESQNLRFGLGQLLELCIKRQEVIIEKFLEHIENSPENILHEAKTIKKLFSEGYSSNQYILSRGLETIKKLEVVTSLFDVEDYPEAGLLRKQLLSEINRGKDIARTSAAIGNGTDG